MDPVRAAELHESIKEHIDPDYTRAESVSPSDADVADVAGFLSVEKPDIHTREKLAFIKSQFDSEDRGDLLYQLRSIEQRLTPPRLGESRVNLLYNYLRARQEANKASKLAETYLDGSR